MEGFTKEGRRDGTVTISEERYSRLINDQVLLEMFKEALMMSANLRYNKKELGFDSTLLSLTFKMAFPEEFKEIMERLRREDGEE